MKSITLAQASVLTSPNPLVLVCSQRPDGRTNLATVSWWTYLSFKPNMVAFAMGQGSYSGERVRETGQVVLATPGVAIAKEVMGCGTASGRSTDKAEALGVALQQLPGCDIAVPRHSRVAIQCRLKEHIPVGDHYLYICEVEQVFGNEEEKAAYAWKGYGEIRGV